METIDIRPVVTQNEFERACELWGTVFPEDRSFFQDRLVHDTSYHMDTTWIASVDGTIASAMQIFPYRMRWGSAELKAGGIGNVATLPQYRSRGLAQLLLRRQSEYMASHGYDLSLLFTLPAELLFVVGGEEAIVRIRDEDVEVMPVTQSVRYNVSVALSESEWVTVLLKGFDALQRQLPGGSEYVRALFPTQPYVFWPVDHF